MGQFFIQTRDGRVATQRQLIEAGVADSDGVVPQPWLRIQGPSDASTMWYAVLRRRERGIVIGTLTFRQSDRHTLLLQQGWEEVQIEDIGVTG